MAQLGQASLLYIFNTHACFDKHIILSQPAFFNKNSRFYNPVQLIQSVSNTLAFVRKQILNKEETFGHHSGSTLLVMWFQVALG